MKKLYSTIMMLAMMVAALSFTACGGDDDALGDSSIYGTWKSVSAEGWLPQYDGLTYIQFKKDGTYIHISDGVDGLEIEKGTWKVEGNGLIVNMPDEKIGDFTVTFTIVELKSDRLGLSLIGLTGYYERVSDSVIQKYIDRAK